MGIFYRSSKVEPREARIKVMPHFELMPLEITRRTTGVSGGSAGILPAAAGRRPVGDLSGAGSTGRRDSLKDIHWKLSAREDQLMVKERGFPLGCVALIYIDCRKGQNSSADGFSKMLETASVAVGHYWLTEEKCIHMAAWYEEKNERIVRWRITDEESACDMIWNLMEIQPYRDKQKERVCYDDTFRGPGICCCRDDRL